MMSNDSVQSLHHVVTFCSNYIAQKTTNIFNESFPDQEITLIDPENFKTESARDLLKKTEVFLTEPEIFVQVYKSMPALKWVQLTFAGVDSVIHNLPPDWEKPKYPVSRYGGSLGTTMAEYVIGQIISRERRFDTLREEQKNHSWQMFKFGRYRQLVDMTIGIIGAGDIGSEIARCCKCFGMRTLGLVRRNLPQEKRSPHIDEYRMLPDLPWILAESDYIISVLPSTGATRGFYSKDTFSHCQKKPVFMNLGRGDCIDEETIIHSINQGWLSGAIIDVAEPEPLADDSKLWDMPEVTITPHVSGFTVEHLFAKQFVKSFKGFLAGETPKYLVDWENKY